MSGWVWLISDVNGLPHRVPEAVAAFHAARGFQVTDIDGELAPDSEEFEAAREAWQASTEPAEELPEFDDSEKPVQGQSATNKKEMNNG